MEILSYRKYKIYLNQVKILQIVLFQNHLVLELFCNFLIRQQVLFRKLEIFKFVFGIPEIKSKNSTNFGSKFLLFFSIFCLKPSCLVHRYLVDVFFSSLY